MADYLHGAYGQIQAVGTNIFVFRHNHDTVEEGIHRGTDAVHERTKVAIKSQNAIVYVGTAPVHTVAGGAANVNRPILVTNIAEARKHFGYSDEWDKYTLCEAMHAHLENKAVGPLVENAKVTEVDETAKDAE